MSILIFGNLYTGKNAERCHTKARCEKDGTIYFDAIEMPPQHIDAVHLSDPIGKIPRTLTFENGAQFETNDHKNLNKWLTAVGRKTHWIHALERNWRFVVASLALLVLVLFALTRWGIPAASESIAARLPDEISAAIGSGTLAALDENLFKPTMLPLSRLESIEAAFNAALPNENQPPPISSTHNINYRLEFRSGGMLGANAFALPNGTVVLTDELVLLAENDEEILSVLLHEIGHVDRRHSLRMLLSHSGLALISLAIIGDVSAAGALVLALPSILVESSYSRDLENEADDYALARMRDLGIEPQHFAKLMLRLDNCGAYAGDEMWFQQCKDAIEKRPNEDASLIQYLSTHPATAERISKFNRAR